MKRIVLLCMITASAAVIGFSSLYMVREFTKVINLCNMGDMWSFLALNEASPYAEFAEVDEEDFTTPPVPVEGDLLVEVDGLPSTQSNYFSVFNVETPAGEEIEIKFLHDSEVYSTTVVTRSIPLTIQLQVWILLVLRTLIIAGLIIVGLWAFIKRPFSSPVRSLTLFCYTLAISMNVTSPAIADAYTSIRLPLAIFVAFGIIQSFYPAFWLKLQMLFPRRKKWYDGHILFINILFFAPALVFGFSYIVWHRDLDLQFTIVWTMQLTLGYLLLVLNHRKAETFIEKRQTKLVLFGSAPGILLVLVHRWIMVLSPVKYLNLSFITRMIMTNVLFLLMLMVPVSLAYALGKYKLLSVEARLKRGTRYLFVSLTLLLVFIGILYLFGNLVLRHLNVDSRTPTLILGLMLAFVFMPTQRKLHDRLEKHFYPERVRLKELLRNFLASNIVRTEISTFWKELENKLADGLAAERIYPVLRMLNKDSFAVEMEEPAPFDRRDQLVRSLETTEYPILFDELMASGKIVLSREQEEWFLARHSAILLPLSTKSGLVGFLVISTKTNGEDFTAEELEMLANFSAQTALVAENFELLNERLIKQKLEEQIKVARDIQKGLLPGEIPRRPGLEVEAMIRFCLEVAGDYYDVIPLDRYRTVLSIGDVAGKGVGPAMLMANLQASLRTTQAMGVSLRESCRQINRIVYENTPSELFITFFMVLIDVREGRIRYVNAGHNPPMLVSSAGDVTLLTEGGMLLGVSKDIEYVEGEVELARDDIVLMYTDGVCEAMNCFEEEFGERRLARLVVSNRRLPLTDLLHAILKEVESHHGSDQYDDDFTLLAARLNCQPDSIPED
ncbi:MAG: PP2C family protein-serine/threonine phosphatase [Candidatus Fermentibacteraceae bacterium]|nr:PP2C family protein-serine/threonine phosphatase [Candidatus Fermentibacteraceae bacterium]MBN2607921.1 PP2C family protein-serine/threonine phosphatase [Candidatus Fermentibacteraceae bacterium]